MSLIKGIHHVALRPTYAQFEKAKTFYLDLLGLKVVRQWGDEKYPCMMISTGDNSCIEVLPSRKRTMCRWKASLPISRSQQMIPTVVPPVSVKPATRSPSNRKM